MRNNFVPAVLDYLKCVYNARMKWYFASRVRHRTALAQISNFLKNKGEDVVSDWIYFESLKPYTENMERCGEIAGNVTDTLITTDIFVLISDPEGTDMFVELGICLGKNTLNPGANLYCW
jgi:hypothetical protein